ncbi:MAG: hypothetical protein A2X84_07365 [Desulfuromonadaceae bacterium GWC2_58_13]|nr:MAG: hypothetical protein A2X84_07365 [Desulfuromonadaceae bacterium GWC2_58_13]
MRLKTLTAGVTISLAIHGAILLFLPLSGDDSRAEVGHIEVGVVYLAAPTAGFSLPGAQPLQATKQSEFIPLPPPPKKNKKIEQVKQSKSTMKKSVKPLTRPKQKEPTLPSETDTEINPTDNSRHQSEALTQLIASQPDTSVIALSPENYPTGITMGSTENALPTASSADESNPSRFRQEKLAQSPSYHINPPPSYPPLALKRHWQGEVWLRVLVGEQGEVIDAWVENSSGHLLLDDTALNTVRNWKFHPARHGEKTVREEVRLPIRFELARS